MTQPSHPQRVAVIGGGPAGLMAAEVLSAGGVQVDVYDAMPSVGRKFLLAGKGGMNITHSEPLPAFRGRYGAREAQVTRWLDAFDPQAVREWIHALGIETFVGTSGRVFPTDMKAAPLLRAWLHRLREAGVRFHMRHRWLGWQDGRLRIATPEGEIQVEAAATVLALGGASWARLGSDGAWVPLLQEKAVELAQLAPSNCGFDVDWSPHFREKHAGAPLTTVAIAWRGRDGFMDKRQGQFVVTQSGIEGSLVYALAPRVRDALAAGDAAGFELDLAPGRGEAAIAAALAAPRNGRSLSDVLRRRVGLDPVRIGLVHECVRVEARRDPARLAAAIKALPLRPRGVRPIAEAISSAGGLSLEALDTGLMLKQRPGVFCAGEMLDWEAPTGGYLLAAGFASGLRAGRAAAAWLADRGGGLPVPARM
jgi:uncharacterized flavoprotein (TIGR03862 family)